ncbi:MFS transporter [Desulfurispora thermophila]|uniref:MFS transporter n=1 Tax=Desulfurispora thermophila TaxID=265470 RepID=UPI0003647D0C|nr:MFS transporter [Desulfurispora thermophila]
MELVAQDIKPLRYRWVILTLCAACFLFTFITRFTWPPLIPVVVPSLGMKMSQAGAFMSAFYIGYIITQIPAGILADRFGVRIILAGSLILEGLSTTSLGFISTYETGVYLRIMSGLGAGAVYASCSRALMEWFPAYERGRAFGILLAAPSGGILVTNLIVPPLNDFIGWKGAFHTVGFLTIMAGILVFLFMRSQCEQSGNDKSLLTGFKVIFSNKYLIMTALAGFCLMWLELGMATWANMYIKRLGYTVSTAGSVMVSYGLGGVIAPLISGIVSDITRQRKWIIIISYVLVIPLTLLFGSQKDLSVLLLMGFLLGFSSYIANPQLTVMISQFAGKNWAATANGVSNFLFQIASLISPWLIGLVLDVTGNFSWVWLIMAAGPLMGVLFMLPVRQEKSAL